MTAPRIEDVLAETLWRLECRAAESLSDEPAEVQDGFRSDAAALTTAIAAWLATDEVVQRAVHVLLHTADVSDLGWNNLTTATRAVLASLTEGES